MHDDTGYTVSELSTPPQPRAVELESSSSSALANVLHVGPAKRSRVDPQGIRQQLSDLTQWKTSGFLTEAEFQSARPNLDCDRQLLGSDDVSVMLMCCICV